MQTSAVGTPALPGGLLVSLLLLFRAVMSDLGERQRELLEVYSRAAKLSHEELAARTGMTADEVATTIAGWEQDGTIRGYQAMVDPARDGRNMVTAFIEVKLTPQVGEGFDRAGERIAKMDRVRSCYLASGGFDLLVVIEGKDLMDLANFVAEKLSPINGVVSCSTHFRLKSYKEKGVLFGGEDRLERLPISP